MKGTVDFKHVAYLVSKSEKLRLKAQMEAGQLYLLSKEEMMIEFNEHPVTKEIEAGQMAQNSSGTLGGYGNLFSFIGFEGGDRPIERLRDLLQRGTNFNFTPETEREENEITYTYSVTLPSDEQILEVTKMPFEEGTSWALGIEKGISGFSNYLSGFFGVSRSGGGIETQSRIRAKDFKPMPYLKGIFRSFQQKFK